jgi:hypothetical protein
MNYRTKYDLYKIVPFLKPGKNPTPSLPYRSVSLFDTVGRPSENNLLGRVLTDMSDRGMVRNEQFAFRPTTSTTVQLALIVGSKETFSRRG